MNAFLVKTDGENKRPPALGSVFVPLLDPKEKLLATFYPNEINICSVSGTFQSIASFYSTKRITAFNSISPSGVDVHWLLVLTETSDFYVLCLSKDKNNAIEIIVINHTKLKRMNDDFYNEDVYFGRSTATNTVNSGEDDMTQDDIGKTLYIETDNSFIKVDPSSRFIIIICFSMLFQFELNPSKSHLYKLLTLNTPPKETLENPELLSLNKYKIFNQCEHHYLENNRNIADIQLTNDLDHYWMIITNKTNDSDYTVGMYQLGSINYGIDFKYCREFHKAFSEQPSLFIPSENYLMILTSSKHYIFPCTDPPFAECSIDNPSVVWNTNKYLLSKDVSENPCFRKFFTSWIRIDKDTFVVSTITSEFYKIEVDLDYIGIEDGFKLDFKEWNIKEYNNISKLDILSDSIFQLPETGRFLCVNKFGLVSIFDVCGNFPYEILREESSLLAITDLKIDKDALNTNTPYSYTCGNDYAFSKYISNSFIFDEGLSTLENHIKIDDCVIIQNSEMQLSLGTSSYAKTLHKLLLYRENGDFLSSLDLDDGLHVSCMISFDSYKPKLLGKHLQKPNPNYSKLFIVSANYIDLDEEIAHIYLFSAAKDKIELIAESTLHKNIVSISVFDSTSFLIWGDDYVSRVDIQLFADTNSIIKTKLLMVKENKEIDMSVISIAERFCSNEWLVVNPYCELALITFDSLGEVVKVTKVLEINSISAVGIYSESIIILGDILGNIFITKFSKNTKNLEIIASFNSTHGSIGCISCYPGSDDEIRKLCSVGTSDGYILTVLMCEDIENQIVTDKINEQNRSTMLGGKYNFEFIASNMNNYIENLNNKSISPIEVYEKLEMIQPNKYVRSAGFVSLSDIEDEEHADKSKDHALIVFMP